MKKFPEFENILPNEPEYDSWLWDGTKPREHEQKKQSHPENKETKKQPDQKPEKQGKEQNPEKEKPKESQLERSKAKTPEQREEDREAIVEKSLQLKKHFENEPLPNDPRLVARILVAEHILALHQQLEEQNPHRKDVTPEELSIALDYMGSLAEKLENPSKEASPDIEEAYVALIELTEEALQTTTPEEIIEHATKTIEAEAAPDIDSRPGTPLAPLAPPSAQATIPGSANQPKPATPQPQPSLPIPPSPSAAILVTTLAALPVAVINQQKQVASPPPPAIPQETGGYYPSYTPSETAAVRPLPTEAPSTPNRLAASSEQENPRTLPGGVAPIAAVALTAAIAASPERASKSQTALAKKPAPQETLYVTEVAKTAQSMADSPSPTEAIQHAREAVPTTYTAHDYPTYEAAHPAAPPPSHEVVAAYTKKIEHLPLHTLLTMAENVPLGYGRYLRQEFESNQIDKAGLIKVLKARSKGRDFSMEYREQSARFRSIKSSPEFLHSPTTSEPATNDDTHTEQVKPVPEKPAIPKPVETPKTFINQVKAAASRISSQEDLPSLPPQSQAPWIIAIIIALIILVTILLFMF